MAKHCPLCDCELDKFAVTFSAKIEMCPNEECIYPFNEKDMFKKNVFEDRSRNSDGTPKKRRRPVPGDDTILQETKATAKALDATLDTPSSSAFTVSSSTKATRKGTDMGQHPKRRRLSVATMAAVSSSSSATYSFSETPKTTSPVPILISTNTSSTASSTASAQSLLELLLGDAPPQSNAVQPPMVVVNSQQPSTVETLGYSLGDTMPDLTFDFLPEATWTTPVTPPNHNQDHISSSNKKDVDIMSSNFAELLFDSKFELDFGSLESCADLEFDADLDAILQQHL